MRIVCVVVAVIAALLLISGLAGAAWTAVDLMDGVCDECSFAAMDSWPELAGAVAFNFAVYGGVLALALWGYRMAGKPKPPSDQGPDD